MGQSSQGTSFAFNSAFYTVTSISVSDGNERRLVGEAHMGLGQDDFEPVHRLHRTVDELPTVEIEYLAPSGFLPLRVNDTGQLRIIGTLSFGPRNATCTSSEVTASVGELLQGTAAFRVDPVS
jgi:hypothetical protein